MQELGLSPAGRRQRWLHPKHLPYLWVTLLSIALMPVVALGVIVTLLALKFTTWNKPKH